MIEARLRSRISGKALEDRKGKILTPLDYDMLLTGPAKLLMPDGRPLCVYLPGAVKDSMTAAYDVLTTIRGETRNRAMAAGTIRQPGSPNRTYAKPVMSSILGSFESAGHYKYCRLTAWTSKELERNWPQLMPLFQDMGDGFAKGVPERYAAQMKKIIATPPEWVVRGTPFTTITVNNSYPTGVHVDKGDLDQGFSCLAVARRGPYSGGVLSFPEYRVGVDMQDGDLILMDAHQWHGNTRMTCACGEEISEGPCKTCGAERISVVAYYRTNMGKCGTFEQEAQKSVEYAEKRWTKAASP